ncbi:MAG: hypothetical protein M1837_003307 [Sclerophora amabilis]|nr:MAG: hypothetical protein M1837_003307 [Sclerophora amabilis]
MAIILIPVRAAASAKDWSLPRRKTCSTPEGIASGPDVDLVVVRVIPSMPTDLTLLSLKELVEAAQEGRLRARCSPPVFKIGNSIARARSKIVFLIQKGVNCSNTAGSHSLHAMFFLLAKFTDRSATTNRAFPSFATPHQSSTLAHGSPDSFAVQGILKSGTADSFQLFPTTLEAKPTQDMEHYWPEGLTKT